MSEIDRIIKDAIFEKAMVMARQMETEEREASWHVVDASVGKSESRWAHPCASCGNADILFLTWGTALTTRRAYQYGCYCGCRGPEMKTLELALLGWNTVMHPYQRNRRTEK